MDFHVLKAVVRVLSVVLAESLRRVFCRRVNPPIYRRIIIHLNFCTLAKITLQYNKRRTKREHEDIA